MLKQGDRVKVIIELAEYVEGDCFRDYEQTCIRTVSRVEGSMVHFESNEYGVMTAVDSGAASIQLLEEGVDFGEGVDYWTDPAGGRHPMDAPDDYDPSDMYR